MKKINKLIVSVLLMFCIVFSAFAHVDVTPRVAIISAFGPEITKLMSSATVEKVVTVNNRSFTLAKLEGKEVVLFLSGVSMVNATMTTQLALDNFNITHILFSGIAGGVNPALLVGDVTIPAKWGQYQEMLFAREKKDGTFDLGWHQTVYTGFGMMFTQPVGVTHSRLAKPDDEESKFWFDADPTLLAVAKKMQGVTLASVTPDGKAKLSHTPKLVVGGNGVSGQTFVDNAKFRDWAYKNFQADCLDMESAAVAHVAYVNGVPFIVFRSLSDLAGGGPGENEIGTFFGLAADNAATVLLQFMKAWK